MVMATSSGEYRNLTTEFSGRKAMRLLRGSARSRGRPVTVTITGANGDKSACVQGANGHSTPIMRFVR